MPESKDEFLEKLVPPGVNFLRVRFENKRSMLMRVENGLDTFGDAAALAGLQLGYVSIPTMRDPEAIAQVLEFISFDLKTRSLVVKTKQSDYTEMA